ncbi:phosphomannomutase/phosphoglucomutase [Ramlibacter henchirensis]|uniref:Phosphomannomutase/phosphoglucomutase n=1 Tax=Ramlibacter henchirensis TaxID=204072 RepID=A0A4Z0C695_9BURK|nr:phosphomannomutase/phosphoglucomutase [Ramlibacter henchirensis]TFZ07237.1 phosphomannomutase/phosphoglucomutase [Ramlibacter henchirensis]
MKVTASVFKAYDIRGTVPATLNEPLAYAIGRAFAGEALAQGERTVVVGRDGRVSSPALASALMRGLAEGGLDVVDIGLATTPMLYFAATTLARSGIQVTASHNPRDDNGFKLLLAGRTLHGPALQQLRQVIEREDWKPASAAGQPRQADIAGAYIDRIAGDVRLARPLKVVIDCGNGVAGAFTPQVLRAIGCDVVELFTEVDGTFPNHHPDPAKPENLRDLIATVQQTGADLGLALDGDGDRLGVVTRSGQIIWPDRQLMLLAQDVLSRHPGAPIVFDVKSTQRLPEAIAAAGGRPVMDRSGYVLLKDRMLELGAPLAGEMSGHLFFNERWYGFDDGTYAAARVLEILSRHDDLGAVLEALPTSCSTPELHVPCAEGEAHRVAAELAALAGHNAPHGAQVCTIDGLRLDWPDGFGLVRASNTTPVLTVRFEGHTPEALQRIEREMMALLRRVKPDAAFASSSH